MVRLENIDSVAVVLIILFALIIIPVLTFALNRIGRAFKVHLTFGRALIVVSALVIFDVILSLLFPTPVLAIIIGILTYLPIACVLYKYVFDLSWKSAIVITFVWFVVQQIIFIIIPIFMPLILLWLTPVFYMLTQGIQ